MTLTAQNTIIIGFKVLIFSEVMANYFPFSLCYFLCTRLVTGLLSLAYIIQLRIRGVVTSPGLCAYEFYIVINCNICELDLLSLIIAVVYSGVVIVIFLFLLMIMDSAQIDCVSDEDKSIYLVLALVHMFSINLL